MTKIALIACSKTKQPQPAKARDLYTSTLFRYSFAFAEQVGSQFIYILSAKHGVIHSEKVLAPYNLTLKDMALDQKKEWAERVNNQLGILLTPKDELLILAGNDYTHLLKYNTARVFQPLEGMRIGERMGYLKKFLVQRNVYLFSK